MARKKKTEQEIPETVANPQEPVVDETSVPEADIPETDGQNNDGDLVDEPEVPEPEDDEPEDDEPESKVDESLPVDERIAKALEGAPASIVTLANSLQAFNDEMKPGLPVDQNRILGKQYDLLSVLRTVIDTPVYGDFKPKFDIVNLFFNVYKDEAFSGHHLVRFDYLWKWTPVELDTLLNLAEVISQLSDFKLREKRIKQINLSAALSPEKTVISVVGAENVTRYYGN